MNSCYYRPGIKSAKRRTREFEMARSTDEEENPARGPGREDPVRESERFAMAAAGRRPPLNGNQASAPGHDKPASQENVH